MPVGSDSLKELQSLWFNWSLEPKSYYEIYWNKSHCPPWPTPQKSIPSGHNWISHIQSFYLSMFKLSLVFLGQCTIHGYIISAVVFVMSGPWYGSKLHFDPHKCTSCVLPQGDAVHIFMSPVPSTQGFYHSRCGPILKNDNTKTYKKVKHLQFNTLPV